MKTPNKTERQQLIEAFGRKLLAQEKRAPVKDQQRLDTVFHNKLSSMQRKYPELLKYLSPEFFSSLESAARKWMDTQVMSGSGKDW